MMEAAPGGTQFDLLAFARFGIVLVAVAVLLVPSIAANSAKAPDERP